MGIITNKSISTTAKVGLVAGSGAFSFIATDWTCKYFKIANYKDKDSKNSPKKNEDGEIMVHPSEIYCKIQKNAPSLENQNPHRSVIFGGKELEISNDPFGSGKNTIYTEWHDERIRDYLKDKYE